MIDEAQATATPRHLPTMRDVPETQRRPMTRQESETFVHCSFGEREEQPRAIGEIVVDFGKHGRLPAQLALISERLLTAGPDLRFSPSVILFLASLCDRPGRCVLWAHYLVVRTRQTGAVVDMDRLASDFPNGFPTDDGAHAIWDAQKRRRGEPEGPDNLLDALWPWKESSASSEAVR